MAIAINQTNLDKTIEMALDKTAMQITAADTYEDLSTTPTLLFDAGTSGGLTTVDTATGIITLGRSGTLKLNFTGSLSTTAAVTKEIYIEVHLDPLGGGSFAGTGYRAHITADKAEYTPFSASFHGSRNATDEIKLVLSCASDIDATIDNICVTTEWMA